MKTSKKQILLNQLEMMKILKMLAWQHTAGEGPLSRWTHSIDKQISETEELLKRTTIDVGTHDLGNISAL